jgi:hypothetical protein
VIVAVTVVIVGGDGSDTELETGSTVVGMGLLLMGALCELQLSNDIARRAMPTLFLIGFLLSPAKTL